jgi:hypothetical protein
MNLTKKHYVEIAHILRTNNANKNIILDFKDFLSNSNKQFDKDRFLKACGVE